MKLGIIALTLLLLLCPAVPGWAWIYDAGSAGFWTAIIPGKDSSVGNGTSDVWIAQKFVFPADVEITRLSAALGRGEDPNGAGFTVRLVSSLSNVAESTLGTWNVHPATASAMTYLDWDIEPVTLQANHTYALLFSPGDSRFYGGLAYVWPWQGQYYALSSADYGDNWQARSYPTAIRIDGHLVPEPSSAAFLAPALGGLFFKLRFVHLNAHRKKVGCNETGA